ncbi:MAG: hypothetical protein UT05_C0019G0004 [Parcubacteria group bacterium GW2011_GWF2_38_76]|nr:MAG: hypothetical protein UT05_C0019G0004 [Parcubacteria group bacterium GW2011_GWF2_38_76]
MNFKKFVRVIALIALSVGAVVIVTGCAKIVNLPPGYVGKILTPTGWESKIYEMGQIDIGDLDNSGRGNRAVMLEATSVTIKEQFKTSDKDDEDHRIMSKDRIPLVVDIYMQTQLPTDKRMRDSIFAQVTPKLEKGDEGRVFTITLQDVYERFAKMTIRGKTREIFSRYTADEVMTNYNRVNKEIKAMVSDTFMRNKVPLDLIDGQLSNVKVDPEIWKAMNKRMAAESDVKTINLIGDAIRRNPGYVQKYKWDQLEKIAGKGTTIIVNDGGGRDVGYNVPLR